MALVCPAGHPPGVGTTFCRLCGRTYLEQPDAPPATESVVPEQAESVEPMTVAAVPAPAPAPLPAASVPAPSVPAPSVPVASVPAPPLSAAPLPAPPLPAATPWPPAPAPVLPPVPVAVAPEVPAPVAPTPYELIPVPATGGLQVHLPLAELPDLSAASELDAVVAPQPGKPAPTDTHPLELGGPVLSALEEEPAAEQVRASRAVDRTAVLAGALAGFLGGAVSGAAITLFLS